MKAIVLAGGKGTRHTPNKSILPKPLIPLGDTPILAVLLHQMNRGGITEVILAVGHSSHLISSYFGTGEKFGIPISYIKEDVPLGTSGVLSLVKGVEETFLVINGDVLCNLDIQKMIKSHEESGAIATIAMCQRKTKIPLGVIKLNGKYDIIGYQEKPSLVHTVSMGISIFEPEIFGYIPHDTYLDFPDLVLKLIKEGELVKAYEHHGYFRDLGNPREYEEALNDFEEMREIFLPEIIK